LMQGLNPGESRSVSLTATYFSLGTFTTTAEIDIFNQVIEPFGEGNNTATKSVTVVPQQTTLNVTVQSVHVLNDGDDSILQGTSAEWEQMLFVLKDGAHCTINLYGQTLIDQDGIACLFWFQDGVDSGETLTANKTIQVTLVEGAPLVAAYLALDHDTAIIADFPEPRGVAFVLSFRPDYLTFGTQTLEGTDCSESNGHCFDVTFNVSVVSTNVPPGFAATQNRTAQGIARLRKAIVGPLLN
jgi:hypothetical protein